MDRGFDLYWKPEHLGLVILVGFDSVIQDSVVLHPGSCSHALKFAVLGTHGLNGHKLGKASILFLLLHQKSSDTSQSRQSNEFIKEELSMISSHLVFPPPPCAVELPLAPRARMMNGGSTPRSMSWVSLELRGAECFFIERCFHTPAPDLGSCDLLQGQCFDHLPSVPYTGSRNQLFTVN